jgi:predicted nucleotidyltransferase
MDNFTTIVSKRGFPYLFDDAAKFDAFKSDVKALLDKYKIPSSNVKVQGSSLRTASAADVDIAVLVSQQEFDALVAAARQGIRTRNAAKPHLIQSLMDQLDAQVAKGRLGATMFDRISGNSKTFGQELYEFKRHLNDPAKGFDLSLILDTGSFNVSPYLSF